MSDETQALLPSGRSPEERLESILAEYLRQLEQGIHVDQQALLAAHPDLADDLREFFGNQMRIQRLVGAGSPPHGRNGTPTKLRYFGDYEILEVIAQGGMGVVYKARQTTLNRVVAVKMILAGQLANESDVKRFQAEAEAAANLHHPGVVGIYEVGINAGQHYYSMEYVEGRNLSAAIREKPVGIVQSAEYLREIAEIVEFAHRQGVLHRDLKPSNVLIDAAGRLRITDFGLAKRVQGESDLTMTGQVLGTPSYMAPEQAAAQHALVGPGSDVYSLGTMFYELLTGRPPFRSDNFAETLRQVQHEEPVRPRLLNPKLPRDLETICLKCLEKEPRRRYLSAQLLADELGRFLRNEPIMARPIGPFSRTWRWSRRKPALASLAALLVVAVAAITTTSSLAYLREAAHQRETASQNEKIVKALDGQTKATEVANLRLYRSLVLQARGNRLSRRMGQRFESLKILAEAVQMAHKMSLSEEDFFELRNEAIACLTLTDVSTAQEWKGWPTGSRFVDFDHKLERYARMDHAGNITVHQVAGGTQLWSLPGLGAEEAWTTLSPDGQFLGTWSTRFKLWSLAGTKPTLLKEGPGALVFRPDSRQVATVCHPEGLITLFELPSGNQLKEFKVASPFQVAFHPRLERLAISTPSGVEILDIGTERVIANLPQAGANNLAWHPEGLMLAVVGRDANIYCWDVSAGKVSAQLKGHVEGTTLAFNESGDVLASAGWGQFLRLWNPQTAELLFQTPLLMREVLRFSPENRLAAAVPGECRLSILDVAVPLDRYRTLTREPVLGDRVFCSSAISNNGRLVASAMENGVALWDLSTGKLVTFLQTGKMVRTVRFEPSDALLASGHMGLIRWEINVDPAHPETIQVGPQQKLPLEGLAEALGMSQDGKILAEAIPAWGGLIWHRDRPDQPLKLEHHDARFIDVSSNGKWVATGSHFGTKVNIWNAKTGKSLWELPVEGSSRVLFSSNSKYLATSLGGNRLWSVDTGKEVRYIGGFGAVAFSPDDKTLAVETGSGVIRLLNPETGRDYARLEDPQQHRAYHATFSADGTQLVVTASEGHAIHVWNLRSIRAELAKRGLDWD